MSAARAVARTRRALGAVLWVYAARALSAWIVASPLAAALVSPVAAHHPRGDAILFDAGGLELSESLRLSLDVLFAELRSSFWIASVLGWLSLVPAAGLLVALVERERSGVAEWTRRGLELLPRYTLLFGARLFVQGVLLALGVLLVWLARRRLSLSLDERSTDLVALWAALPCLALAGLVSLYEDLARVELVRGAPLGRALRRGAALLASRIGRLTLAALVLAAAGAVLPLLAAPLAGALDVSRPGTARVVGVLLVHQAVILALIALRAVWLAYAIELGLAPPGTERLAVDLQVTPGGSVPAQIQPHEPPPEPAE